MAIYYVRTDGNDGNTGLAAGTAFAWKTINKALSASGIASGDTVYVAPGVYATQISVAMTSATTTTTIMGNPSASLFPGVAAGRVIITNYNTSLNATGFSGNIVNATSKNYLSWNNIMFKLQNSYSIVATTCRFWSFINCFFSAKAGMIHTAFTPPLSQPFDHTFARCIFQGGSTGLQFVGAGSGTSIVADTTSIQSCQFNPTSGFNIYMQQTGGFKIFNCTINGSYGVYTINNSTAFPTVVKNCIINVTDQALRCDGVSNAITEDYNRILSGSYLNVSPSVPSNSSTIGDVGYDVGESLFFGLPLLQPFSSYFNSINKQFGIVADAPTSDVYGVAWTGITPDAGAATYRNISAIGDYYPTERNANTITIAPGSTSQSIELYLGAIGLTASTPSLAAYYNRTRTASVNIPLIARTISEAWTAGGFAEVNATTMPGVYRLDIPNDALNSGADDVTIVVRGASTTNGAVMTIKLQSIASDILSADLGSGTNAGTLNERTVRSALRSLRNKVSVGSGTMTVYKENDADTAWTGSLSNTSDVTVDPS